MNKYTLEDFEEFINSADSTNKKIGWTMIKNSINPKTLSLESLCRLQLKTASIINKSKYDHDANNFFSLVTKILFNKYSKRAILKMYEKINKEGEVEYVRVP